MQQPCLGSVGTVIRWLRAQPSFVRSAGRLGPATRRHLRPWGKQAGGSQDWEWPDWQGWQEHSPRARRPSSPRSRRSQRPQGQAKAKGPKGKPKETMEREGPVAPKAAALPPPPAPATPSMPSSSTSNMAATLPSTEQTLLRALVAHVASQEGTPSELQQLLGQYQEDEHKATARRYTSWSRSKSKPGRAWPRRGKTEPASRQHGVAT